MTDHRRRREPGEPRGHYAPHPERFWAYVKKGPGCWEWQGSTWRGYGQYTLDGRKQKAHRIAWELTHGPIPEGLELDHVCRNHGCVRPDPEHLEPVTHRENMRRSPIFPHHTFDTHCKRGHPFDEANTYRDKRGWRQCRACLRESNRQFRGRRKPGDAAA